MEHQLGYALFENEHITGAYLKHTIEHLRPAYRLKGESGSVSKIPFILSQSPDFLVSDALLSDGETLKTIRSLGCRLPIVLFTAHASYLRHIEDVNVVYSALKPVPEEIVEEALLEVKNHYNKF